MTQFIIITGNVCPTDLPSGIGVRHPSDPFVSQVAEALFPGEPCFQLFDSASGEADSLFDDLYNSMNAPEEGEIPGQMPVVLALTRLAEKGRDIVCWYADDHVELPVFDTSSSFITDILRQASQWPPEIYSIFKRRNV